MKDVAYKNFYKYFKSGILFSYLVNLLNISSNRISNFNYNFEMMFQLLSFPTQLYITKFDNDLDRSYIYQYNFQELNSSKTSYLFYQHIIKYR